MGRLPGLTLAALLFAVPAFLSVTPRPAQAFCITCYDLSVIEYVNETTGHYLLLPAGDPEIAIVEGGGAGPGWVRTGNDFTTTTYAELPVCRFYSPVFNTHFYTADAAECALVKHNTDWVYEKSPFNTLEPYDATCSGAAPVYRFYHAGDHRYTADTGIRDAMLARGWTYEGIAFCVARGGREAVMSTTVLPTRVDSVPGCLSTAGNCVALDSLVPMPNQVPPYLPPEYFTVNPAFPTNFADIVGNNMYLAPVYTSQPADAATIAQHSFAGTYAALYVNGSDRTGGDYASISPMAVLPGVAGSNGDQRVYVWRGASDHERNQKGVFRHALNTQT